MDQAEAAVAEFLTRNGLAFICPQFDFPYKAEQGGSAPDFVAIDLVNRDVAVVEVTTSADINGLLARVEDRNRRWYGPLREQAKSWKGFCQNQQVEPRFIGFIRQCHIKSAYAKCGDTDVTFVPLELVYTPWHYWKIRGHPDGCRMPDAGRKEQVELPWSREQALRQTGCIGG